MKSSIASHFTRSTFISALHFHQPPRVRSVAGVQLDLELVVAPKREGACPSESGHVSHNNFHGILINGWSVVPRTRPAPRQPGPLRPLNDRGKLRTVVDREFIEPTGFLGLCVHIGIGAAHEPKTRRERATRFRTIRNPRWLAPARFAGHARRGSADETRRPRAWLPPCHSCDSRAGRPGRLLRVGILGVGPRIGYIVTTKRRERWQRALSCMRTRQCVQPSCYSCGEVSSCYSCGEVYRRSR
jgi:hypothetical protein